MTSMSMARVSAAQPALATPLEKAAGMRLETVAGFVGAVHPAFALQFWPVGVPRAHLVYLPPFAEEMNRCRSLVSAQARWFARTGLSCSILDFYGTGESPGDLSDATLPIWRRNIDDLVEQLLQRTRCPLYLWGFRLGGLLALDYLTWKPGAVDKLLLWQPVSSGSTFVTQMLRQRTAALMQKGEKAERTADMKVRLAAGEALDVAGYRLGGELVSAIDRLEMDSLLGSDSLDDQPAMVWLEHSADQAVLPAAKTRRIIDSLQQAGARIEMHNFTGDPVWQLHKRGVCDDLLAKTRELNL